MYTATFHCISVKIHHEIINVFFNRQYLTRDLRMLFPMRFHPFQHRIGWKKFKLNGSIQNWNQKFKNEIREFDRKMSGRVNFRWNNIISNNFSTFLECFDSRDLWLAIKISRKIEHRTSACRQFHRNRIYFLLSIW